MNTIQIRAVIFQEASLWCAQCLEHDVAVQAASREALIEELNSMLASYVELALVQNREPFAGIPKAPHRFFDMFERAHELAAPKLIEITDAPAIAPEIRVLEAA